MCVAAAGLNRRFRLEHRRQEVRNLFDVQENAAQFLGKLERPFHRNVRDGRLNLRNLRLIGLQIGLRNAGDAKPDLGMLQFGAALDGGAGAVFDRKGGLYGREAGQLFGGLQRALHMRAVIPLTDFHVLARRRVRQVELALERAAAFWFLSSAATFFAQALQFF